jgi:hypothetical protein
MVDKQGYMDARVCTLPGTHAYARTHTQTTATMIRQCAWMVRYMYIAHIVSELTLE